MAPPGAGNCLYSVWVSVERKENEIAIKAMVSCEFLIAPHLSHHYQEIYEPEVFKTIPYIPDICSGQAVVTQVIKIIAQLQPQSL